MRVEDFLDGDASDGLADSYQDQYGENKNNFVQQPSDS